MPPSNDARIAVLPPERVQGAIPPALPRIFHLLFLLLLQFGKIAGAPPGSGFLEVVHLELLRLAPVVNVLVADVRAGFEDVPAVAVLEVRVYLLEQAPAVSG